MTPTINSNTAIYPFGGSAPSIAQDDLDREIVGGKGLGLQVMGGIGINIPPGFTMPTTLCQVYATHGGLPAEIWAEVQSNVLRLESDTNKTFGSSSNPLLLSVRSGAAISMPGMMDTVLNIGLNDVTVEGLAKATDNPRFAYDAYRRLLNMFGDVVRGIPHEDFEERFDAVKAGAGVENDVDLNVDQLRRLCTEYKAVFTKHNQTFPSDPQEQLRDCVAAVFGSWNSSRAVKYREINKIKSLIGTAANVQTMVFGNMGDDSGTGVAFSRNPSTGTNELYGEYLINAQGEDVVAGIRTPQPISQMAKVLPSAYKQFVANINKLERHFKDMQDVEFTVEKGRLWMLQCRSGKRTGPAAIKIAIELERDGICSPAEAILKVDPDHVRQLLHPQFSPEALKSDEYKDGVVAKGLAGGPGAAVGKVVFTPKEAEEMKEAGEVVVLVRETTSPEDVGGMWAAAGILTARGGMTSHAAVVARGWGKPCICGCSDLVVNDADKTVTVKKTGEVFKAGDVMSINGSTGEVIRGSIPVETPSLGGDLGIIMDWADAQPGAMKVMANADSGPDAAQAASHGSVGVGLCRTEHMFFAPERLPIVRRWIFNGGGLEQIKDFQRTDFRGLFEAMDGKMVTIRLLDPPLHEFLPRADKVTEELAEQLGYAGNTKAVVDAINAMHEENPMLGLRGCRLGIIHPEFTEMQVEAIMNAAADMIDENPKANPRPRIMIPLIGSTAEYKHQALICKGVAERINRERMVDIPYEIGTMIEVPRAALISDHFAALVDEKDGKPICNFFSFGTNDLTQMAMGISRDDANEFIPRYLELGIFAEDPFKTIDEEGVGQLVKVSVRDGLKVNPNLSLSVCGEHGGDPKSISFFHEVGLNYISCSPFRVPVARLAAGQAAVRHFQRQKKLEKKQMQQQQVKSLTSQEQAQAKSMKIVQ